MCVDSAGGHVCGDKGESIISGNRGEAWLELGY